MSKNALILGCGRSGTSIFGELFDHLPEYTYYSEPEFALLEELDYAKPVAVKVPKESPGYQADPGLSFPLKALHRIMPEPKQLFWQIRHPLDTIASLKVGISRNWGHHPRPPDWRDWLREPLVARCAHHWRYLNAVGYEQVAGEVIITRFEEMLGDPEGFALSICSLLDITIDGAAAGVKAWARRVQNTDNDQFVEAQTSRPYSTKDHRVRVGRWRENFSREELDIIWPLVRKTAAGFGYRH